MVEASSKDLAAPEDQPGDKWTKFSRQLGRKFAHLFLPKLFEDLSRPRYGWWWNATWSTWTTPRSW